MSKILIAADSTCDLSEELTKRYNVAAYMPLHVVLGEKTYNDGVDIKPDEIYRNFEATGTLPKTAACNIDEYEEFFRKLKTDDDTEIIFVTLGHALSSTSQNAVIAGENVGGVYVVDSCNLSTGSGHIVIEGAKMIEEGKLSAQEIAQRMRELTKKSFTSFVIDKLDYLRAGGRCSTLAMLGANLLKIKPSIIVNNEDGSMTLGKKYRGNLDKVLIQYVDDQMAAYPTMRTDKIFITHAGIGDDHVKVVYDYIKAMNKFDEIYITTASCTISSHCGPKTLGILFMTE